MANKDGQFIKDLADVNTLDGTEFIPIWQNNRTLKGTPLDIQTFVNGGSGCTMLCAQITLTSAQVLALNTTPQIIVAAPGANKIIEPLSCLLYMFYDTVAYGNLGNTFRVKIDTGSAFLFEISDDMLGETNDQSIQMIKTENPTGNNYPINRALEISLSNNDVINGDSEVSILCTYRIINMADVAS